MSDSIQIVLTALAALLVLFAIRVPIAVALGIVSFAGIAYVRGFDAAWGALKTAPYEFGAHWSLSAVPMFLLMGAAAFRGGLTASLFEAMRVWFGRLPGGLAIATNMASAVFAAASGSSVASSAAMARIAVPEMLKSNYSPALATGVVAAAGTLGALIPPSIIFVIFGWYTQTSIGTLLIAGIIPGLLTAGAYALLVLSIAVVKPEMAPRDTRVTSFGEKMRVLGTIWPVPVLIVAVIGSIYSGVATATEAAALGAVSAILLCLVRGTLTKQTLREMIGDTVGALGSIFFIALGASLLTRFLALSGFPAYMMMISQTAELSPLMIIMALVVVYLILGAFLDPIGIMLVTLPILLPLFRAADLDMIWMGVIIVKMIEIGMLTPPVGLNVFVVKAALGERVPLGTIFKGVSWFLMAEVVIMGLLIAFPQLSLWLPNLMAR
ncbi:TRAP transporter large permease [Albimonas sp. CAU 1670]|uniref:TRAP transporter large permease n=1 Tax=Albimonas sp. CAU 1670 TaxID=3032599 RepID=UPI0023D9DAF0|nr:TRAP transporter large permease [Albimonas sp. CAU 1670]MDF2235004.1 TRAP transporter large permease [Albimonas sp. CAU 1670]